MVLFSNCRAKARNLRRALGTGVPKQLKVSKEKEDIIGWVCESIWLNARSCSLPHLRYGMLTSMQDGMVRRNHLAGRIQEFAFLLANALKKFPY